jgi:cytochrome c biogenesis protein CcdA
VIQLTLSRRRPELNGSREATGATETAWPGVKIRPRVILGALGFGLGLSLFLVSYLYARHRASELWKQLALPIMGSVATLLGSAVMGFLAGLLLGPGSAAGWAPCTGPVLGTVPTSGIDQGTSAKGMPPIVACCVGLVAPFVLVALLGDRASPLLRFLSRQQQRIPPLGGALALARGVLVVSNNLPLVHRGSPTTYWPSSATPSTSERGWQLPALRVDSRPK